MNECRVVPRIVFLLRRNDEVFAAERLLLLARNGAPLCERVTAVGTSQAGHRAALQTVGRLCGW